MLGGPTVGYPLRMDSTVASPSTSRPSATRDDPTAIHALGLVDGRQEAQRGASVRRKIDDGRKVQLIHTVRGVGFLLREEQSP